MSRHLRILSVAVSLAVVFVALAPGARGDMARPTWTVGDFWKYSLSGEAGLLGPGSMRMEVVGTDPVTVGGVTHSSHRLTLAFNFTAGAISFNVPGEMWVRSSDLALVKTTMSISINFPPFQGETTIAMTLDPPEEIRWPLTTGNSWSVTSLLTTIIEVTGQTPTTTSVSTTTQFAVESALDVTVPAGTFSTTPVRGTASDGYEISFWSPEAGNYVRQQAFDNNDVEQGAFELTSYSYQAASLILGLPTYLWLIVAAVVIAVIVAAVVLRRRKRPGVVVSPPTAPPAMPPTTQEPPVAPPPEGPSPPGGVG